MSTLHVFPVPHPDSRDKLRESTVVVIDVLRASSTILEALQNGAKEVIPVAEPEQAMKLKSQYAQGQVLLSGERMGVKIEGFDMGNSPVEFSPSQVGGKTIIMCSTNGTKAMMYAANAQQVLIGSFRNLDATIRKVTDSQSDIYFLGSGKFGQFCLEDMVCAGGMIEHLLRYRNNFELADSAYAARVLYEHYKQDLFAMLKKCEHGKYLTSLGFENDLKFCAQISVNERVPELHHGILQ